MTGFTLILALALLVQFIVERIKTPIPEAYRTWAVPVLAMIVSMVVCFCCKVGLFGQFSLSMEPIWLDYLLTGLILSGGSTLTNELIKALQGIKTLGQNATATSVLDDLLDSLGYDALTKTLGIDDDADGNTTTTTTSATSATVSTPTT